jgi:hypothetical protein
MNRALHAAEKLCRQRSLESAWLQPCRIPGKMNSALHAAEKLVTEGGGGFNPPHKANKSNAGFSRGMFPSIFSRNPEFLRSLLSQCLVNVKSICFVSGHGFSRAANAAKNQQALELIHKWVAPTSWSAVVRASWPALGCSRRGRCQYIRSGERRYSMRNLRISS